MKDENLYVLTKALLLYSFEYICKISASMWKIQDAFTLKFFFQVLIQENKQIKENLKKTSEKLRKTETELEDKVCQDNRSQFDIVS